MATWLILWSDPHLYELIFISYWTQQSLPMVWSLYLRLNNYIKVEHFLPRDCLVFWGVFVRFFVTETVQWCYWNLPKGISRSFNW